MKPKQKLVVGSAALAAAALFMGMRIRSAFGAPAAPEPPAKQTKEDTKTSGSMEAAKDTGANPSAASGGGPSPAAQGAQAIKAADVLPAAPMASDNIFESLVKIRRDANSATEAAKKALDEVINKQKASEEQASSRSAATDKAPDRKAIAVRALVEAGPRSTVIVGDDLLNIGDTIPGTDCVLERVERGKAYFRLGEEVFEVLPRARKE